MIEELESDGIDLRAFCEASGNSTLKDAYNLLIEQFAAFRALHYRYAREYIFEKVADHTGTGGTPASIWLKQLHDTTLAHRV
jgi:indoleamine 2,3-dioxygenase